MASIESTSAFTADRPWIHLRGSRDIETLAAIGPNLSGLRVFSLDGAEMVDVDSVFEQYYREFEFPTYFGGNWPAFEECLTTLENLPARGYLTLIHNAERVLAQDRRDLSTFLRVLGDAGRYWSNALGLGREWGDGPVPFNTIFLSQNYTAAELSLLMELQ
ncbi:barstar family protein [Nocardia otitidiscaviarum]|uniref:barstar family protein n=1 Tax=Nocardia otitidiscaviarum TaxID=1823 RepID=UPI001892E80D|nr:barstar family protein [Nocardia otitidiscaviarum]MBF6240216.1 barstar family protein [Nocardia otitidiscaviarum]